MPVISERFVLVKRGKRTNRKCSRYFTVDHGELIYFRSLQAKQPAGTIPLNNARCTFFPGIATPVEQRKLLRIDVHTPLRTSAVGTIGLFVCGYSDRDIVELKQKLLDAGAIVHCNDEFNEVLANENTMDTTVASEEELPADERVEEEIKEDTEVIYATALAECCKGSEILSNYQMLKVVGQGGFGQVVVASHKVTGVIVAIKSLNKKVLIEQQQVEHTKSERSFLIRTRGHPFIIKLHQACQTIDHVHLVFDYCAGGELFHHLQDVKCFTESQVAFYAAEMILAILHLHNNDIVHRDLKPENILLDVEGHVQLVDFGLSKEQIEKADAFTFCGSADYLAPEMLDVGLNPSGSIKSYGKAIDCWSLGCLIFEMLTGLPPFYSGYNRHRLYSKIQQGNVNYPPTFSEEVVALLRGLLTVEPQQRLTLKQAQQMEYFRDIDWDALMQRKVPVPFLPRVTSSSDTSHFDSEFTSMEVPTSFDSVTSDAQCQLTDQVFDSFTWTSDT